MSIYVKVGRGLVWYEGLVGVRGSDFGVFGVVLEGSFVFESWLDRSS